MSTIHLHQTTTLTPEQKRIGEADPNWPDWYAEYMVREQTGEELPQ